MTAPVQVGDILADKYRVERVLGQGGMGVVVGARHLHLGESVAIKFLLPRAMANAEAVSRFGREARAAARLKSEHVGRVYDVGTMPSGAPYMVMEFLEGDDLGALLAKKGPLPVATAIEYLLQACEAIAVAHAAGVVHRDLKPSNLFITRRPDGSACIKVIDFGISKLLAHSAHDVAAGELTDSAMMMGSPLYMPPEQMRSAREVDGRADVWSLGCILYALLTGEPPFMGETVMGVYDLILRGAPSVESRRPDVPAGLDPVIARALAPEPDDRYPDVAALCAALVPFASAEARRSIERVARTLGGNPSVSDVGSPSATLPIAEPRGKAGDGGTAGSWESAHTAPSSVNGVKLSAIVVGALFFVGVGGWFAYQVIRAPAEGSPALAAPTVSADASVDLGPSAASSAAQPRSPAVVVEPEPEPSASAALPADVVATTPGSTVPRSPPPPPPKVPTSPPKPPPTARPARPDLFAEPQ